MIAEQPTDPQTDPTQGLSEPTPEQANDQKKAAEWRARIEASKAYRRKLIPGWSTNIDYRRGKPFASQSDEDRISVPIDWARTKAKEAALFSQVPQVRIDHAPQTNTGGWTFNYEQRLNDTLVMAGIETAMEECLPDCINAAGFGAVLVTHEAITEMVTVPKTDLSVYPPDVAQQIQSTGLLPDGSPFETIEIPRVVDHRYKLIRLSPSDFLHPLNFTGASFDDAPWLGRSGRVSWAQGQQLFKLKPEDKQAVCGDSRTQADRLTSDLEREKTSTDDVVSFDEIFYKEFEYDPEAKSYTTIRRLVFVNGKNEPVIDEPWSGQRLQNGVVLGAQKFPIRVLTLTYITDEAIPPSDTAIGRPQVNEINKSRTQMIQQRQYSLPVRWFNTDRLDILVAQSLMRGTWQGMIPVQGNGDAIVGEVARSNFPSENFTFDNIAKSDLDESWQIGPNQSGSFGQGRQSASESKIVQSNFSTRVAKERAKVSKFVVSIAEVLGGLLSLFEEPTSFGEGFDPAVSRALNYSILADSTVIRDSDQRREAIKDFINFTAKSGYVDIEPVLKEFATLSGVDPNNVRPPKPSPPAEPTVSLRLSGVEDLMNPLVLAFLMQSGQAPKPELIEQAKRILQSVIMPPAQGPSLTGQGPQPPQGPMGPGGMPPQGMPPGMPPMGGQPPMQMGPPPPAGLAGPGGPMAPHVLPAPLPPPQPPPPAIGSAHADWGALDRINKRVMNQE